MTTTPLHITCDLCKHPVPYFTSHAYSSLVCGHCGQTYRYAGGQHYLMGHAAKVFNPIEEQGGLLELGTVLRIRRVSYTIVGICCFKEKETGYKWREYTLHHAGQGYCTLSEFDGNFNLVREIRVEPQELQMTADRLELEYNRKTFRLYNRYELKVISAVGEFPYRLDHAEQTAAAEYLKAPQLLILHSIDGEPPVCFMAEYVRPRDLEKSTGRFMPPSQSANPTRVLFPAFRPLSVFIAWFIFLALVILTGAVIGAVKPERELLNESFLISKDSAGTFSHKDIVVPTTFDLTEAHSNIGVQLYADVSNDWFATYIQLVNETTGKQYGFEQGVEIYSGVDDGEPWSEGSNTRWATLSSLPAGHYHMVFTPYTSGARDRISMRIRAVNNRPMPGNAIWILVITSLLPIGYTVAEYFMERKRWRYSDYSPYTSWYDEDE